MNLGRTRGGGVHVASMFAGIGQFLAGGSRESARRGMVAAVSVVLADVLFGNPTRDKVITAEVRAPVIETTRAALTAWEHAHPAAAAARRARCATG